MLRGRETLDGNYHGHAQLSLAFGFTIHASIYRFGFKWLRRSSVPIEEEERWIKEEASLLPHSALFPEVEFEQRHLSEWDSCGRGRQRH